MGAHSLQALPALLGAPRGQWCVISLPDGSAKNRLRPHGFDHFLEVRKVRLTALPESIKNQRGRESIKNCRRKERIKNWRGRESIKKLARKVSYIQPAKVQQLEYFMAGRQFDQDALSDKGC